MEFLKRLFGNEPTLLVSFVRVTMVMFIAFGLNLTVEQVAAVVGFSELLFMLVNRALVVSVNKIEQNLSEFQADKVLKE